MIGNRLAGYRELKVDYAECVDKKRDDMHRENGLENTKERWLIYRTL